MSEENAKQFETPSLGKDFVSLNPVFVPFDEVGQMLEGYYFSKREVAGQDVAPIISFKNDEDEIFECFETQSIKDTLEAQSIEPDGKSYMKIILHKIQNLKGRRKFKHYKIGLRRKNVSKGK